MRFLLFLLAYSLTASQPHGFLVERVIDGDTIVVRPHRTVRLLGIDAPELKYHECGAVEAREYVRDRIEGRSVRLTFEGKRRDKYGRELAWVWYGAPQRLLNADLVEDGWARSYNYFRTSRTRKLDRLEQRAQVAQIGRWNPQKCP